MELANLDGRTRRLMRAEIERDLAAHALYMSDRLSPTGEADWPNLLLAAADSGDTTSLATELSQNGRLNAQESYVKDGIPRVRKMNRMAPQILAEGEINRFYIRALCLRAIEDHVPEVEVYRAKAVAHPRPESLARIGMRLAPAALLEDLRTHIQVDTALGIPGGPNSGLSVRLPATAPPSPGHDEEPG